jgi:hypothetical protein
MHTTKYLKDKKLMLYFPTTKKANICFSMYFGFNNQVIKAMRTRPIYQKYQKNILFSFSIWDCEFTRKMYSF